MTKTTLRAVTLKTVDNYRQVAERTVGAYRASGLRLLSVFNRGVDRATRRGTDVATQGIDKVSEQTERVIEMGSARVSAQVERVADLVEGIENRYIATGLQAAARVSLSGAQAALTISEKLATGANKLSSAIQGPIEPRVKATAKRAQRAVTRRAKAAVKPARRAVAPAKAEIQARTKAVRRRVKTVTKKVVAAEAATEAAVESAIQPQAAAKKTRSRRAAA